MKKILLLLLLSISCYAQESIRIDLRFTPNLHKPSFEFMQSNWKLLNKLPELPPKTHFETDLLSDVKYYYIIELKHDRCKIIGVEESKGVFRFDPIYLKEKTYP